MNLLTASNPKLMKGTARGYLSFVLHLSPADRSGYNVCPMASAGCKAACLNTAGRGGLFKAGENTNMIQEARIRKTRLFFEDRTTFMLALVKNIRKAEKRAKKLGLIPVIRLNGTSDIRWETVQIPCSKGPQDALPNFYPNIMSVFPHIQFYDYTKLANRKNIPANYHLTFSRSEENDSILPTIDHNIAVVFGVKKGKPLPSTYLNRPVVDGDETDLRFLDPKGVIVGLRGKGKARKGSFDNFVVAV